MPLLAGLARDARRAFEPKPGTGNGYAGGRNESMLYNLLGAQTKSGKVVTEDAALGLSAYYRGIAIRSNIPGTLPMHAYRKASDGRRQQVDEEYPWIRKPNREVSRPVFWVTVFAHLSSWNNAFIYVVPKDRTKPGSPQNVGELYPLEPKRVRWGRDAAGDKVYAIDGDQPARAWTDPKPGPGPRLVHIPGWGTDGMGGRAAWMLARQSLGIGIAAEDKAANYFDKDTAPVNGYLSSDQELSADQCQQLSEAWDDGADLGTRVMAKGTKWITTDIDPEKLQLFQTRGYTVAEYEDFLARARAVGLGDVISPVDFGLAPIRRVHSAGFVNFLQNAWSDWQALGRSHDMLPMTWPTRSMTLLATDFSMMRARCVSTVRSLMPRSAAITSSSACPAAWAAAPCAAWRWRAASSVTRRSCCDGGHAARRWTSRALARAGFSARCGLSRRSEGERFAGTRVMAPEPPPGAAGRASRAAARSHTRGTLARRRPPGSSIGSRRTP